MNLTQLPEQKKQKKLQTGRSHVCICSVNMCVGMEFESQTLLVDLPLTIKTNPCSRKDRNVNPLNEKMVTKNSMKSSIWLYENEKG